MSNSTKRFIYLPEQDAGSVSPNSYTDLMIQCWEHAGYERIFAPRGGRQILQGFKDRGKTACVANWVDNFLVTPEGKLTVSGMWTYLKTVIKLHLLCKHVVFVRHNVYPHAAKGKTRKIAKTLVDLSEVFLFDKVFVHSRHFAGRRRKYIPHPAYQFSEDAGNEPASDDLVYFGNFGRYKNLEALIAAWKRPSRLIIAGYCRDEAYLEALKAQAEGKNIHFIGSWLSDDEARRLVRSGAGMVLPHSGADMVISSSLYFAISCGVPAICNQNAHARQLVNEGVPGVVCIESLDELNDLDIAKIKGMDRQEIEAAARERCSIEKVASIIEENV